MLVLTRKNNESIMIDDNIIITILDTRKGIATVGIDAPKEIKIVRTEIMNNPKKLTGNVK